MVMIDYTKSLGLGGGSPIAESGFAGLQQGQQMRANELSMQDAQQQMAIQEQEMLQKRQKQEMLLQQQQDLIDFSNKPNKTHSDYLQIIERNPTLSKTMQDVFEFKSKPQKENLLRQGSQVFSALNSGKNEVAQSILENLQNSYEQNGDMQTAQSMENIVSQLKSNPEVAKMSMGLFLSAVDKDFSKNFETLEKTKQSQELLPFEKKAKIAEIKKMATERGLTKAQTNKVLSEARKIDFEIANIDKYLAGDEQDREIEREKIQLKRESLKFKQEEPIRKRQENFKKATRFIESFEQKTDNTLDTLRRFRKLVKPLSASFGSKTLSSISGTEAKDLRVLLQTIQANFAFNALQEMRQNSPTGGALGSVSERELDLLSATVQNLDPNQSINQLIENVDKSSLFINNQSKNLRKYYNEDYSDLFSQSVKSGGSQNNRVREFVKGKGFVDATN